MPGTGSAYPWRCANDADYDILGHKMPQGAYRSIVWGSTGTFLYSLHPANFGKKEVMTMWGFPAVTPCWNYEGWEGKNIRLMVFSGAEEVEVFVNGKSIGRKPVSTERPMPGSVCFDTVYSPGKVEAVSYTHGKEVSRDTMITVGEAASIRLVPEKKTMKADGHDLIYVGIEILDKEGNVVPVGETSLNATISGSGMLAGFGSGNPKTEDNYTDGETRSFRGRAMAILRSGYSKGTVMLTISSEGLGTVKEEFTVI